MEQNGNFHVVGTATLRHRDHHPAFNHASQKGLIGYGISPGGLKKRLRVAEHIEATSSGASDSQRADSKPSSLFVRFGIVGELGIAIHHFYRGSHGYNFNVAVLICIVGFIDGQNTPKHILTSVIKAHVDACGIQCNTMHTNPCTHVTQALSISKKFLEMEKVDPFPMPCSRSLRFGNCWIWNSVLSCFSPPFSIKGR